MFPFTSAMQNFLTLSIYWIGASLISSAPDHTEQLLLFSDMIVFTSYALQVVAAFLMVTGMMRILPRATVASQRIQEVIERMPSIVDGTETECIGGKEDNVLCCRGSRDRTDDILNVVYRIGNTGVFRNALIGEVNFAVFVNGDVLKEGVSLYSVIDIRLGILI